MKSEPRSKVNNKPVNVECKVQVFHDETFVTLLQKFDKLRSFYKNVGVVRFLMDSNPVHIL